MSILTAGLVSVVAGGLTWWLLPWVIAQCQRWGLVSYPTARCAHTTPTPRAGGLAFVLGTLPVLALVVGLGGAVLPHHPFMVALVTCSVGVALLGWLDDKRLLTQPWARFALQLVLTAIPLYWLPPVFDNLPMTVPWWADRLFLWLGWTWFINLFNFMDAGDGLAAQQAAFMGVMISLLWPDHALLALPVAAGALAFLRVNAPPAKIFMGDIGACWWGYVLAGLMISLCAIDVSFGSPSLLISLVFAADATITLGRRLWAKQKVWEPHRAQWVHRAFDAGLSHRQIFWAVVRLNAALGAIAWLGTGWQVGWWMLLPGVLVMLWAAWRVRALELR